MPVRKKPNEAELIAARVMKKRAELVGTYHLEQRSEDGEWWVFLIVSLAYVRIELPIAHVANESIADTYATKTENYMIDALLDYQAIQETTERM